MRVFPLRLLPLLLAACGTPLQVCVTKATHDLTVVDGLIADSPMKCIPTMPSPGIIPANWIAACDRRPKCRINSASPDINIAVRAEATVSITS